MTFTHANALLPQGMIGTWQLTNDDNSIRAALDKNMPTSMQLNEDGTGIWQDGVNMFSVQWFSEDSKLAVINGNDLHIYNVTEISPSTFTIHTGLPLLPHIDQNFHYLRD